MKKIFLATLLTALTLHGSNGFAQANTEPSSSSAKTGAAAKARPAAAKADISAKSDQAVQAFKAGDFARAIPLFRAVVALSPRDAFDWHFLGRSLDKTGDLSGARKAYQKSLDLAPTGELAMRNKVFLGRLKLQGKVFADCPGCPKMVVIPAGSFDMGTKSGGYDDEIPLHRVTFQHTFAMGRTEVTQGLWKSIMGSNPSANSKCGDYCPVEQVSWNDVQDFIKKLDVKTGKQYRLPTEAEWEYACRAGAQQTFCGSDEWNSVAWFEENSSHPVAEKLPNTWGMYDMNGNVWEWIADPYHDSYNGAPTDGSMWNGDASIHVVRGGSWYSAARYGRASIRGRYAPDARYNDGGFRLVRSLP
jgi:tetratricopeptide (TPR) repeat protein